MESDLLSIGSFAALCGLTIKALHHYDDVGVLKPASVDAKTGYRYYAPDQVRSGHVIRALRAVDMPLETVSTVLNASDDEIRSTLIAHREALALRAETITQQLEALDEFIEKGVHVSKPKGNRVVMLNLPVHDGEAAKRFYEDALGIEFFIDQHGEEESHYAATFGEWPDSFFLMQLVVDPKVAGTANYGFFCEDLEGSYAKALAAGATDLHGPLEKPGMPRNAYVKDPSGNILGLYQS